MSYATGAATSPGDMLSKLYDFAAANGWTVDDDIVDDTKNPAWGTIHKNNVYITTQFDSDKIKMYPSRGFTSSATIPGQHPESAHAASFASLNYGQRVLGMAGGISAYHFFESDTYIHVVLDLDGLHFRHFGFGEAVKTGDWLGGEYCYGHTWAATGGSLADNIIGAGVNGPFASYAIGSGDYYGCAMIYGKRSDGSALPGANAVGSKWGVVSSDTIALSTSDQDGGQYNNFYALNGHDGGIASRILSTGTGSLNGFTPMIPMQWGIEELSSTPKNFYILGSYPDVRAINMIAQTISGERVIDTDTWVTFPVTRMDKATSTDQWSANFGLAYKKVIA